MQLAATVAGLAKYTNELGDPILPLKFRFDDEMQIFLSSRVGPIAPKHGPHDAVIIFAPAVSSILSIPSSFASFIISIDAGYT